MVNDQETLLKMMKANFIVTEREVIKPEVGNLIFNTDDNELYISEYFTTNSVNFRCYQCSFRDRDFKCPSWSCIRSNLIFVKVVDSEQ